MELYIYTQNIWVFVKLNAAVANFNETHPPDLKSFKILLLPSDVDSIVMRELAEFPSNSIIPTKANVTFAPVHVQREHLCDVVQPYALRVPEVVLGLECIDIWSLGC